MLESAAELFPTQGYHGTGLNELLSSGEAPKGSLYFHFPGGKEQLAVEAVELSARRLSEQLRTLLAHNAEHPGNAIVAVTDALADELARSGFTKGCPLATISLEAASGSEPIRAACEEGYRSWHEVIAVYLVGRGLAQPGADILATIALTSIEGALLLSKTQRDVTPLRTIGDFLRLTFEKELS